MSKKKIIILVLLILLLLILGFITASPLNSIFLYAFIITAIFLFYFLVGRWWYKAIHFHWYAKGKEIQKRDLYQYKILSYILTALGAIFVLIGYSQTKYENAQEMFWFGLVFVFIGVLMFIRRKAIISNVKSYNSEEYKIYERIGMLGFFLIFFYNIIRNVFSEPSYLEIILVSLIVIFLGWLIGKFIVKKRINSKM